MFWKVNVAFGASSTLPVFCFLWAGNGITCFDFLPLAIITETFGDSYIVCVPGLIRYSSRVWRSKLCQDFNLLVCCKRTRNILGGYLSMLTI